MSEKKKRIVFISATYLSDEWENIPKDILDSSIFFFGSNRSWIWPKNDIEREESLKQPTKYLEFSEGFKSLMLKKESEGLLYFLKPEKDFTKVSEWITKISDPVTPPGKNYNPLILDDKWWLEKFDGENGVFCSDGYRIKSNYGIGSHGYPATMELLFQSNKTMIPVLDYDEKDIQKLMKM